MSKDQFKKRIMRSIYMVFILKKLFNTFSLKIYAFVGLIWVSFSLVSIENVFRNMLNADNLSGFYNFITYAFLHTTVVVQALSVVIAFVTASMISDLIRRSSSQDYLKVSRI